MDAKKFLKKFNELLPEYRWLTGELNYDSNDNKFMQWTLFDVMPELKDSDEKGVLYFWCKCDYIEIPKAVDIEGTKKKYQLYYVNGRGEVHVNDRDA